MIIVMTINAIPPITKKTAKGSNKPKYINPSIAAIIISIPIRIKTPISILSNVIYKSTLISLSSYTDCANLKIKLFKFVYKY